MYVYVWVCACVCVYVWNVMGCVNVDGHLDFFKDIYCTESICMCTRINYIIFPVSNLNKYLHCGTSETELHIYRVSQEEWTKLRESVP